MKPAAEVFSGSGLRGALSQIANCLSLSSLHVSLYTAMLYYSGGVIENPFYVSHGKRMRFSKIMSFARYHKCIKELKRSGFLIYELCCHPLKGRRITLTVEVNH